MFLKMLVAVVLMLFILGSLGDVVKNFKESPECRKFFLDGEPPAIVDTGDSVHKQIKQICQKYGNSHHFATLYDTSRKIPVYSAYEFHKKDDCKGPRPKERWRTEPQLDRQAKDSEYSGSDYTRGHLYPACHARSKEAARSTFTLTNAAPQKQDFNQRWYDEVEEGVGNTMAECVNTGKKAYAVVGVVPSKGGEEQHLKAGSEVNVPTHYWCAYSCCVDNNKCTFGGYIMHRNVPEATAYKDKAQFEGQLKGLYRTSCEIKVFADSPFQTSLISRVINGVKNTCNVL